MYGCWVVYLLHCSCCLSSCLETEDGLLQQCLYTAAPPLMVYLVALLAGAAGADLPLMVHLVALLAGDWHLVSRGTQSGSRRPPLRFQEGRSPVNQFLLLYLPYTCSDHYGLR